MKAYEQAVAINPDIFEQHSSQGVLVQERTVEERAGYFYILAKTCAKAGHDRADLAIHSQGA